MTTSSPARRYYLIRRAGEEDLPPERDWYSAGWTAHGMRPCRGCTECDGFNWIPGEPRPDPTPGVDVPETLKCEGNRVIEDLRTGLSAAERIEDVPTWLAHALALDEEFVGLDPETDLALVEVEGQPSTAAAHDQDLGEVLILPVRILSRGPIPATVIEAAARITVERDDEDDEDDYY